MISLGCDRTVRAADVEARAAGDDVIVLDRSAERVHVLNKIAGEILQRCRNVTTPASLTAYVCERYDVDAAVAEADVGAILATLASLGLVHVRDSSRPSG
jgi:PqqD family protein of HPr-rel-A system